MEGWIKLHRKMTEWEWFSDSVVVHVFLYCLLMANNKDRSWQGITICRGEFITSVEKLSRTLNVSIQQTRTALRKLKSTNDITIETTNKYTRITISNYDRYQAMEDIEQQTNQQADEQTNNKRITNEQQTNNNNVRIKEYKNKRNIDSIIYSAEKSAQNIKPSKTIEERESDFMELIAQEGRGIYPDEMLRAFFNYWSESNQNGKKMRFEMQKTFDVKKRLATWASNEQKYHFKSNNYGNTNDPTSVDYVSTERIVAAGRAMAEARR